MGGHKVEGDRHSYFTLSVPTMIKGTCALPLFGVVFCVLWSLIFDFHASTRTHCKVWNCLPTISAVIGGFTPQRYVWRICITLHAPQRLMVAVGYYNFHTSVPVALHNQLYRTLALITTVLNIIEVLSLIGLSMISSTENHDIHENLFISFMACGLTYMLLTIILMRWGRFGQHSKPTVQEVTSVRYKTGLFLFKLVSFALAVYMFFRHNDYCEPGALCRVACYHTWDRTLLQCCALLALWFPVYTAFAFFEYLTVLANIGFHSLIIVDFHHTHTLMLSIGGEDRTAHLSSLAGQGKPSLHGAALSSSQPLVHNA